MYEVKMIAWALAPLWVPCVAALVVMIAKGEW